MSTIGSLFAVARDALQAHAAAVDNAGNNIANAETPGYVRRTAILQTRPFGGAQSGGVVFAGAMRMTDRFASARVVSESGLMSAALAHAGGLEGLEAVLGSGSGTVGERMTAFFSAATELASNPTDPTARAAFLARADDVASSFRNAAQTLASRRSDLLGEAQGVSGEINVRLKEAATLNEQIAEAQALGQPASDLRDRRDLVVREIGDKIGVQAVEAADGTVTLLSSGTSLLSGNRASSVSVSLDGQGAAQVEIVGASGTRSTVTSRVSSGQLAGILEARDRDIPKLAADLNQLAFDFASKVNTTHAAGFAPDGSSGRPLYAPPAAVKGAAMTMALDASMAGHPERIAAAATAQSASGGNDVALELAAIGENPLGTGGPPAARFGEIGATLGRIQSGARDAAQMRGDTLAMAESTLSQASGVSVEEEMVDLTRYQRAFEASMKVLKVADELLEGLIRDMG